MTMYGSMPQLCVVPAKNEYAHVCEKPTSFLQFHIAQRSAQTPVRMCLAIIISTPSSHVPNNESMLSGGAILKAIRTVCHRTLASGHWRKRCVMFSSLAQKLHRVLPSNYVWPDYPWLESPSCGQTT